jgi:hypothetical protein
VTHLHQILLEELLHRNYAEATIHAYIRTVDISVATFIALPGSCTCDRSCSGRSRHSLSIPTQIQVGDIRNLPTIQGRKRRTQNGAFGSAFIVGPIDMRRRSQSPVD